MKWEAKELDDGRWGIFLCKKYWKFKDRPVMYAASITKESAESRVNRLNNPDGYSFDEKYVSVGMAREKKKKEQQKQRTKKTSSDN